MSTHNWGAFEQAEVAESFERVQEIPEEFRTPEHYFIEEAAGSLYPIPRDLYGVNTGWKDQKDDYTLTPSGAIISHNVGTVWDSVELGARTEVKAGAIVTGATVVGKEVEIGSSACVDDSIIGDRATIDTASDVIQSTVDRDSHIGDSARIFQSKIGRQVSVAAWAEVENSTVEDDSSLHQVSYVNESRVGRDNIIGADASLWTSETKDNVSIERDAEVFQAELGQRSKVGEGAVIGRIDGRKRKDKKTIIGDHVSVQEGTYIKEGRRIKNGALVIPYESFKKKTADIFSRQRGPKVQGSKPISEVVKHWARLTKRDAEHKIAIY